MSFVIVLKWNYLKISMKSDKHSHILNLPRKFSRCIGILCKLTPFLNTNNLKNLYYSLFYSHLVYVIQVWGSACASEINKIQVLQKRALRIITHEDTLPSVPEPLHHADPLFLKLEILKYMISLNFSFQNLFLIVYICIHRLIFIIGLL